MRLSAFALASLLLLGACASVPPSPEGSLPTIGAIDPPLHGFFSRQVVCRGIPVRAHADVSDQALYEVWLRMEMMLREIPVAARNMREAGVELRVIGKDQLTSDLPALRHWKGRKFEGEMTIDQRGRGFGGLITYVSEDNVLKLPTDAHRDHRDITVHEFAHTIHLLGLSEGGWDRIVTAFKAARDAGLWPGCYAMTNEREYFAELAMWYYGTRGDYGRIQPAPQEGPEWLERYDPQGYALIDDIFSGRIPVAPIAWTNLPDRLDEVASLRSLNADEPVEMVFVNESGSECLLYWINYEGGRQQMGRVLPGDRTSQTTFATHPWVAVDSEGRDRGAWNPTGGNQRAVIR